MPVIYGWRPGSQISIDAAKAGRELERIEKALNRPLTAEDVLERARDDKNVLHGAFEWDDAKAAHEHRIGQAGHLMRSITVDISRSNLIDRPVRAYVNVTQGENRGYTAITRAMSDIELRKQVIERAYAELEAWRSRYAELTELARIFAAIDQARGAA